MDIADLPTLPETGSREENFVQTWLDEADSKFVGSSVLRAISDATNLDRLDEAKLVTRLRELAKASSQENAS